MFSRCLGYRAVMSLLRLLCYLPAAEGVEAYTVGLIRASDLWKYTAAMSGAMDPTDGDNVKMAGGFASIVFDEESGESEGRISMYVCILRVLGKGGAWGRKCQRRSHRSPGLPQ